MLKQISKAKVKNVDQNYLRNNFMSIHMEKQQIVEDKEAGIFKKILAFDEMLQLYTPERTHLPFTDKVNRNKLLQERVYIKRQNQDVQRSQERVEEEAKKQAFMAEGIQKYKQNIREAEARAKKKQEKEKKPIKQIKRMSAVIPSNNSLIPSRPQSNNCSCTYLRRKTHNQFGPTASSKPHSRKQFKLLKHSLLASRVLPRRSDSSLLDFDHLALHKSFLEEKVNYFHLKLLHFFDFSGKENNQTKIKPSSVQKPSCKKSKHCSADMQDGSVPQHLLQLGDENGFQRTNLRSGTAKKWMKIQF